MYKCSITVLAIVCCYYSGKMIYKILEMYQALLWALPKWFSKYWDFAKIGISRIFRDFRALLWGFQMPAGG